MCLRCAGDINTLVMGGLTKSPLTVVQLVKETRVHVIKCCSSTLLLPSCFVVLPEQIVAPLFCDPVTGAALEMPLVESCHITHIVFVIWLPVKNIKLRLAAIKRTFFSSCLFHYLLLGNMTHSQPALGPPLGYIESGYLRQVVFYTGLPFKKAN